MKTHFLCLFFILLNASVFSQDTGAITASELKKHVEFLASDSLKGRKPGTPEAAVAARYILQEFLSGGLTPLCDNGFQYFGVITDVRLGGENIVYLRGAEYGVMKDYVPLAFTSNAKVFAPVVFVGYGFDIEQDSLRWNDYEGMDVAGKWVMIFRADPEPDNPDSRFIPYSDIRSKILTAKDKQAAGVLLVTPGSMEKDDRLIPLVVENNEVTAGIPVIHLKRSLADSLLLSAGVTADSLDALIINGKQPKSMLLTDSLLASAEVIQQKQITMNVVAMLEGTNPALKDQYLVIGAHYDHLGLGGPGSNSRMPDTTAVHNGADDNASGTAMVIELAKALSRKRALLERPVIFAAFSAEEMGLLGSRYFIDHPPVPLSGIRTMFNFDMVGRFDADKNAVSVSGTGTSQESDSLLRIHEKDLPFQVTHAPDGYGPSDHAAFYAANIPVFYFNTGVHTDYHTPFDDTEKVDFGNAAKVAGFAESVIMEVDRLGQPLTFRESGSKAAPRTGRKLKVTLGIMPDFAGTEKRGLRIDGVTKDGPAYRGGLQKGDVIVAINGLKVGNIYEYMSRLSRLKHGQTISVEVIRDEKNTVLLVQL